MSTPADGVEDRYELIRAWRNDQRQYIDQHRIKGEPIETEVTNYALLCVIGRERAKWADRTLAVMDLARKLQGGHAEKWLPTFDVQWRLVKDGVQDLIWERDHLAGKLRECRVIFDKMMADEKRHFEQAIDRERQLMAERDELRRQVLASKDREVEAERERCIALALEAGHDENDEAIRRMRGGGA